MTWECGTPAAPKCFTASRDFLGPRSRMQLLPVGARRASWSKVMHSPPACTKHGSTFSTTQRDRFDSCSYEVQARLVMRGSLQVESNSPHPRPCTHMDPNTSCFEAQELSARRELELDNTCDIRGSGNLGIVQLQMLKRQKRGSTLTMRARAVSVNLSAQTLSFGTSNSLTSSVMVPTSTATLSSCTNEISEW